MPIAKLQPAGGPVELAYLDEGQGSPVVLIHGFASTRQVNWVNTGWVRRLAEAGRRVVAFDNRGHGESSKFHDPADYSLATMAEDAFALIEELGLEAPDVVGYSMGARIAATMAIRDGERLRRVVLSGNGWAMTGGSPNWQAIRDALLAEGTEEVKDQAALAYRVFAEQTGSDLAALAACAEALREGVPTEGLSAVGNPVLVAVGSKDEVAGSGERLAGILPHGRFLDIPGRDHMRAVGDKGHIAGVLEFLTG